MAEQDPKPAEIVEIPVDENIVEVVVIEEVVEDVAGLPIPPDRPRKVYSGMWGPFEIAAVAIGFMVLLASTFIYFFWALPAQRELARNRSEADRLEAELASARTKYGDITTTETQVARIVTSMDDFESRSLPMAAYGQPALYQRLNSLMLANNLINTSGPDYAPLEAADTEAGRQSEEEKGRSKYRSLFPGVYVTTTVEGSYQNLRRFIRELETGREFIVLSAIELAPSDTETKKAPVEAVEASAPAIVGKGQKPPSGIPDQTGLTQDSPEKRPKGKAHGETVTLRIEMAAYFRRPNYTPASVVE